MIASSPVATFAERLAALRRARGWTQQQLGRKLGLSMRIVGYWEDGARQPTAESLEKLADVFGVSMDHLWTGREERCASCK